MTDPVLKQTRQTVRQIDGTPLYSIESVITSAGDLPFKELFVFRIDDPANPRADVLAHVADPLILQRASNGDIYVKTVAADLKTFSGDVFARVSNPSELTTLSRDRETALARGQREYLSASLFLAYADLPVANAAGKTILDRVSTLVTRWREYRDGFRTASPVNYSLPQLDIGVEAALKADWQSKRTARILAQTVRDTARQAVTDCQRDIATETRILTLLQTDVDYLQRAKRSVEAITDLATPSYVASTSYGTQSVALVGSSPTFPGGAPFSLITTGISGQFTVTKLEYTASPTYSGSTRNFVRENAIGYYTLQAQKESDLASQRDVLRSLSGRCAQTRSELDDSEVALRTAQNVEDAALAAIIAVCPTFDPTSV